ncbi:MAG: prolyl-tRNA synthetase associated domain-containing protein [Hyphomicrobiales bacterium]|nr:prolyl-tRNA synthetase associated domain-containing protein [Hyphomicrobiales bacterium]
MPATRSELFARLDALGIDHATVVHPPLHTVEESKRLRGDIPGAHTKNLFLKCKKGTLWLIVALESAQVPLKRFHTAIGSGRLSFGKPELLREVLGIEPGSVSPFALINDTQTRVSVILDEAMMACDPLNFHPLENTATTAITGAGLLAFIDSCGHRPRIMDLTAPQSADPPQAARS